MHSHVHDHAIELPREIWGHIATFCDIDSELALRVKFGKDIDPKCSTFSEETHMRLKSRLHFQTATAKLDGWHINLGENIQIHKRICDNYNQVLYSVLKSKTYIMSQMYTPSMNVLERYT